MIRQSIVQGEAHRAVSLPRDDGEKDETEARQQAEHVERGGALFEVVEREEEGRGAEVNQGENCDVAVWLEFLLLYHQEEYCCVGD